MEEWTIHELQKKMSAGEFSAKELAQTFLDRIEQIDKNGPRLNAVIELNPDALPIADRLDEERKAGKLRGPLHGIPILIKDNIDTADRMTTAAGSLALDGSIAAQDAALVERLRTAGVVLLGKTNLSEWANFRSTHSSSGWSSRGGQTRNPYVLDRNPCGSSSGSGAAVAANLCTVAVGTETDGSIVCPSHANGIVGIKPTVGLVSRSGIIPISHSQDTAGPMARTVADAAILLGVMSGVDPLDPATHLNPVPAYLDYAQFLGPTGLKGKRIGVARDYFGFDSRVDVLIETCLAAIKDSGAVLVDPVKLIRADKYAKSEGAVLRYEFKADLAAYLSTLPNGKYPRSLEEVIKFNEENKDRVMPYFGQERMLQAHKKGPLTSKNYLNALARSRRLAGEQGILAALQKHNLDALVAPTGGVPWLTDLVNGDHYTGGDFSSPAAVSGYPHITVPAGYICGLPIGISFCSGPWQEPNLIQIAYAFEQATRFRRPPQFLPSVNPTGA